MQQQPPTFRCFFYDGEFYELDFEQARTLDQDILLPDRRILVVGKWEPVPTYSYSSTIAYHRPTRLRERNASVLADLTPEGIARLAHARPASFADQRGKASVKPFIELDAGDVEQIITETLGLANYCIAEGWERDSYHRFCLAPTDIEEYLKSDRAGVFAFLAGTGSEPQPQMLLAECIVRGVLDPGNYLIASF